MFSVSSGGTGLGKCSGDCDSDSDCRGDLKCFQCDGFCLVPGCGTTYKIGITAMIRLSIASVKYASGVIIAMAACIGKVVPLVLTII